METIIIMAILAAMAVAIVALQTFGEKPLSKEAIEAMVGEVIDRREKERRVAFERILIAPGNPAAFSSNPRGVHEAHRDDIRNETRHGQPVEPINAPAKKTRGK